MATETSSESLPRVSVEHIVLDDSGVARIAGRRTKVSQIVIDKCVHGWSVEEIQRQYPYLELAEIYAALTYYHDHQSKIDDEIRRGDQTADEIRDRLEPLNREVIERMRAKGNRP